MNDRVEFFFDKRPHPFLSVASSMFPNDGDLINIEKQNYKVLGRSFTVDYAGKPHQQMRCNIIVEKVK